MALLDVGLLDQVLQQHGVTIHEGTPPSEWAPSQDWTEIGALFSSQPYQLPAYA